MQRIALAVIAAPLLLSACYRVTVVSGAPPAAQVIDKPWQNSFVYGLVPPKEVAARPTCAQGVAKVVTERSFVNGLVGAITLNIYTPMHVNVTCASSPTPQSQ
jgi:hypothetical protein